MSVIKIDRSRLLPSYIIDRVAEGWTLEEDENHVFEHVDIDKIILETGLVFSGEYTGDVDAGERARRIRSMPRIRLDLMALLAIVDNNDKIPDSWKNLNFVAFEGTFFVDPDNNYYFFCLHYEDDDKEAESYEGNRGWVVGWLHYDREWGAHNPSATMLVEGSPACAESRDPLADASG